MDELKDVVKRNAFQSKLNKQLKDKSVKEEDEIEQIWNKLKECVTDIASEICGKEQNKKKQNWMNSDILDLMEERRKFKNTCTETGRAKYKGLKHTIQKQCRLAKDNYYNEKCIELEELDRIHSQLVYKKIKEFQPRKNRILQHIKDKQGKSLQERGEILERWAEYVEDLYKDKERGEADRGKPTKEVYSPRRRLWMMKWTLNLRSEEHTSELQSR